jgi:hypothetical protein
MVNHYIILIMYLAVKPGNISDHANRARHADIGVSGGRHPFYGLLVAAERERNINRGSARRREASLLASAALRLIDNARNRFRLGRSVR